MHMEIDDYESGRIVVDGKPYTEDVIISDKVYSWRRDEGHHMKVGDIKGIGDAEVVVIGTGASGIMEVSDEVVEHFKKKNIKIIIQKTTEAVKTFNSLGGKKAAMLHLTC